MEGVIMVDLENDVAEALELDEATKNEVVKAIEKSLKGEAISDYQANLLFYWSRHQNDKEFNFVPKQYRLKAETSKKRKAPIGK